MNFFENLENQEKIYKRMNSKEAKKDLLNLSATEYYKKYYWFLPEEIINNMDKIIDEINRNNINNN